MNKIYILFLCLCYAVSAIMANTYKNDKEVTIPTDANIFGHVVDKATGEHLPGITIILKGTTIGSVTDDSGHYMLKNLPEGEFTIEVSFVGFKTVTKKVTTGKGKTQELNFELEEDLISLEGVVVSANRNETKRRLAPTLVKVLSPTVFEKTNSTTLAQGLVFQPGVRVENDCQNCGYSQVRINGMEGKYTQILIDSRPIFSALAGVYGLEQIPANMIERVEVIRGGGSALFGSSAIAGTINIITKEPIRNSGSFGHTISNLDGSGAYDNNTTLNLSWVSSDNKMGAYIYGQNRYRSAWDSNGDGFSELPKLKNQTIGFNGFYKTSAYSKLNIEYHHMEEYRRGGSGMKLPPHIAEDPELNGTGEAGLVEQLQHSINTGSLKFNLFTPNQKHNLSFYASGQHIHRDSYYSAYGRTTDFTGVMGAQYIYSFDKCLFMPADLTGGIEFCHDDLDDRATDKQKYREAALAEDPTATGQHLQELIEKYTPASLHQIINVWSAYAQNEWKNDKWSFLIGGRVDKNSIMDKAVFSPRANVRYNPTADVNLRLSYAEGFRAPQAFDEDLHISNVGGARVSIVRDPNLKEDTIPMLPERLCNFICSLRPNEEKLAFSVIFDITEKGEVRDSRIVHTVINSDRRFTYEEAQQIIETKEGDFKEEVLTLDTIAKALREKRFSAGAINFDRYEVKFEIDEKGKPISVYFKESKDANKLVEEFMLLANKTVAEKIGCVPKNKKAKVLPYRIHDLPDPEKLENLSQFIARFGYKVRTSGTKTDISKSINHLLDDIHGKKEENLIETVSIRAMQKARYSTHNIGHYGLAFEYYTHFTSPIRRFPDMMVHRLVTKYMDGGRSVSEAKYEDLCDHSSNMEQIAANAERASIKYKQVEFMSERLGQIYDGVISGVTEWGLYVELNENKCEGLVPVRDLDDDYYEFDEKNYCLRGRRKNKIYSLGDAITVRVARANLEKKQLDFELIEK